MIEWMDLGLLGLFLATFLAATILPFSSEAILAGTLMAGFDPLACLIIATFGNTLGGMTNYGLGYLGDWQKIGKWLRVRESAVNRWQQLVNRYGAFAALLCWMPFVGDVIAIALGVFKVNVWRTTFWMLTGKALRYAVIIWFLT